MTAHGRSFGLTCLLVFSLAVPSISARAVDPNNKADWVPIAESRLKAIYDRGEFRAKRFRGTWLPDSSGYTVEERDSETGRRLLARYDVESGERVEATRSNTARPNGGNRSPNGQHVVEVRQRNLFLRDTSSDERTNLTGNTGERDLSFRRISWSSDGRWAVFVESDETDVRQRSMLVPGDPSYPSVRSQRFARVGESIAALRVGIVDSDAPENGIVWLPTELPSEGYYLGQLAWTERPGELVIEMFSRFRNERDIFLFNANSGELKTIFSETNPAWCVSSQRKNSGLIWVNGGESFVVISEKDGWRHAFLVSRDGDEETVLTPGNYDLIDRAVVDQDRGWFYFYASPENATQSYLFRVNLDGSGEPERITPEDQPGTHTYDFSPDRQWAFHTWSAFDQPPTVDLVHLPDHRAVRVLEDNKDLLTKLNETTGSRAEFLELSIHDDVTMDAWMIKPKDLDPSKKYPVLVYVYGEPHAQTVLDQWGTSHADFHRMIADLGYLVVSIDNRGTPAPKGAAWRREIFGSLGPLSTEEQAAGIRELARIRPYVDLDRVAIWGWSGGGSNTLNALFRMPDLYDVGIAIVPKPQPHLYNAWFQEIYMRDRKVNPEGYERSAPLNFAQGLKGDLLIVTGSGETNTHIQIVEGLVDRLIELGKTFDYMVYPNRNHGIREGKGTAVHLRMLMTRYLVEHLAPGPR